MSDILAGDTISPQAWALSAALHGESKTLFASGISPDKMSEPYRGGLAWVSGYAAQHGRFPTRSRFTEQFPDVYVPEWDARPSTDLADQFYTDLRARLIRGTVVSVGELIASGDQKGAEKEFEAWLFKWSEANARTDLREWKAGALTRLSEYEHRVAQVRSGEKVGDGILTGIKSVDEATLGFLPGDYVIFAGRFDVGKTTLMVATAEFAATTGRSCLFISPEHTAEAILRKLDAMAVGVNPIKLRQGTLTPEEVTQLNERMAYVGDLPGEITVVSGGNLTVDSVASLCTHLHPDVVYVDGLSFLVPAGTREDSDWLAIGTVSRNLKRMAVSQNVVVVCVTQGNRGSEKGGIKDNLARSDMIGQDADIIIGIEAVNDITVRVSLQKCRETPKRPICFLDKSIDGLRFVPSDGTKQLTIADAADFL